MQKQKRPPCNNYFINRLFFILHLRLLSLPFFLTFQHLRKQITRRRVYHHLHCKCISSVTRLHIINVSTLYIINRNVVYNAPKVQFMRFIAIHEGIAFNSCRPKFAIHYVNQRLICNHSQSACNHLRSNGI